MGGFFQELAKKLAERWVGLLFVPGALFVVGALLGVNLGHAHALDWTMAVREVSGAAVGRHPSSGQAVVIVALLLAATAVGLVVQAMTGMTRAVWLGRWPRPFAVFARWLTVRRRTRWHAHLKRRRDLERAHPIESRDAAAQHEINLAAERVTKLAMAEPGRPTWMGDRIHAVEQVALNRYGLDLTFAWPRLWLVLPETARTEITSVNGAFAAAVTVGSWAWPALVLGTFWWPALVAALVVGATGWVRARAAITDLSSLTEATLDIHGHTLAAALGVVTETSTGPLTINEGQLITAMVRKGR
ncbi:hypothetical protein LCL61_28430 [Amycolatopsis coloradensis]|uniref:Uncharacterized protein n=1 Tax=Amycolatopsis coloradensis TaxID=76021 RepID=A0ACD5BJR0_9PSEU